MPPDPSPGINEEISNPPMFRPGDKIEEMLNSGRVPLQANRLAVCHRSSQALEHVKSFKIIQLVINNNLIPVVIFVCLHYLLLNMDRYS